MDALSIVEDEVRELVRRRGLDPAKQPALMKSLIDDVVRDYDERALLGAVPALGSLEQARRAVYDNVAGFGALQQLLDDPSVEEIWINSPHQVFCARGGQSELTHIRLDAAEVAGLVERMLKASGRRLDLSQPFVDCQLPDGSRLHVVIPDITHEHWAVNIRKFILTAGRLQELVELMQTRLANLEGTGEITMRRLVKEALRMRPDRIIVGQSSKSARCRCWRGRTSPATSRSRPSPPVWTWWCTACATPPATAMSTRSSRCAIAWRAARSRPPRCSNARQGNWFQLPARTGRMRNSTWPG